MITANDFARRFGLGPVALTAAVSSAEVHDGLAICAVELHTVDTAARVVATMVRLVRLPR
jgi:hypothetical protein